MPRPIPLVEPVTSDTFPASSPPLSIFSGLIAIFMACLLFEKDIALSFRHFAPDKPSNTNAYWLLI
jgi:hypothetical protein